VITRSAPRLLVPAVTVALLVALTGCGKPGAQPGTGPIGSSSHSTSTASTGATADADPAADSATLDGIRQDLDSADAANGEAGSNAAAGDQAGATGDEP
jgi:hypothetical protein